MNERFKFRVWCIEDKKYYPASDFCIEDLQNSGDEIVVEQCTGLRDKNGRLIYEGDIVFCESGKATGVIKFEKGSFVFEWNFAKPSAFLVLKYTDDVEIVGNIHEVER